MLLDGYPKGYLSHLSREARWIRGDFQIIKWLKSNLSKLSKFKILDNIRRSLLEIFAVLNIFTIIILKRFTNINIFWLFLITLLSIAIPSFLDVINFIIFRKENIKTQKKFTKTLDSGITSSFYRALINIMTLPTKAYISLESAIISLYRMNISKMHLLEWTTSEEAEKKDKNSLGSVILKMLPNIFAGLALILLVGRSNYEIYTTIALYTLSFLFLIATFVMWEISHENVRKKKIEYLTKDETEYIKDVAKRTWDFFAEYMNKENNYLPPDNFQASRREKIVNRTSSTNIGLGLLTIVSAYDLKFINLEEAILYLENSLNTIKKLERWNGNFYNWYNTKTLEPLIPKFISTVDSGNLVRLYVHFESISGRKKVYSVWR